MKTKRFCILCGVVSALLLILSRMAPSAVNAQEVSFVKDVAPILKDYCFACHDAKKRSGKYDMTTFDKLLAGGASGEPITVGKPADSEFHDLIVTKDERRMPPRKDGLSAVPKEKADVIAKWISQGAKLDPGIDRKADLVRELRIRWQPPAPPAAYKYGVPISALAFTPDGKRIVAGGNHELTVWEIETGKLLKRIHTRAERAQAMLFLKDGLLAVAGSRPGQEGDVRLFDINAAGKKVGDIEVLDGVKDPAVMRKQLFDGDDAVLCLALSGDGKLLAAGGTDRLIRLWKVEGGSVDAKLEQTIENHADWVFAVAFDAENKRLLSGSRDKTAKIWDIAAKESITTFPDHQATVFGVVFSKDGKQGCSAGSDRQIRLFAAQPQGKQARIVGSHNEDILRLVPLPDGHSFLTAGADKKVKLWDLDVPKTSKTLEGMTDQVFSAAASADGKWIAAGDYNGEVRIWNAADGKVAKAFNASPGYVAAK